MREAYKQLRHYLQELDWVGSGLVYEGPLQGFQFLWQEEGVLWAPEGEMETAKKNAVDHWRNEKPHHL